MEQETIRASNDMLESGLRSTTGTRTATDLARHLLDRAAHHNRPWDRDGR